MTSLDRQLRTGSALLIILVFAASLFLSDIWTYKEFVRAESYFALGARLMIEQNEWVAPHAPDEVQLNKPPLTYWLIALSYKVFGVSYGAARLPSALAGLGVLTIVYFLASQLYGRRIAVTFAAILASSYLFLTFGRMAMSDMLLTLFVTGALASFIYALNETADRSSRLVIVGYVCIALGVLTKGPVAIALIGLPIIFELALARNRADLKRLRLLTGFAISLLVAAPYFLLVYKSLGGEPLRFFFLGENVRRFTGGIYGTGARPWWYEIAALFSDFAPWSLFIPVAVWLTWRNRHETPAQHRELRILYLWLICTILLFSLSSFKLDYYLLPAMPAAALIVGHAVSGADSFGLNERRAITAILLVCCGLLLFAGISSFRIANRLGFNTSFRFLPALMAFAGTAIIVWCLVRGRVWFAIITLAATLGAGVLMVQWTLTPSFSQYLPAQQLAAAVPTDRILFTSQGASDWANCLAFNLSDTSVLRLTEDKDGSKLRDVLDNEPNVVILLNEREYEPLRGRNVDLEILAEGKTFGHGGLTSKMLRGSKLEKLLLVSRIK